MDWASFKPLGASHPTSVLLDLANGIVVYKFESIHLPDSNINEVASHGFFQFTIRMKPNLPEGSVLENLAAIYFDFNPAVLTNTVKTSINQALGTSSKPGSPYLTSLLPNPNSGIFSVELPLPAIPTMTFRIAGLTGQVLQELPIQAGAWIQSVQTKDLPAGLYFLQIVSEGRVVAVEKFVKQ